MIVAFVAKRLVNVAVSAVRSELKRLVEVALVIVAPVLDTSRAPPPAERTDEQR